MPDDPTTLALVLAIVALGAALQGAAGFGMALIAAPPLMILAPELIPGPLIASGVVLTGAVALRDRAAIDFSGLRYSLLGRALGTALAALFLAVSSAQAFDLAFGLFVLTGVGLSAAGIQLRLSPLSAGLAGLLSGLMGTISAIGGPPMALLYQHSGLDRLRATLSGYFVLGVGFSLLALAAVGRFGWSEFKLSLLLSPAMAVGFLLSILLQNRLPERAIRPIILILSLLSGVWVIYRAA